MIITAKFAGFCPCCNKSIAVGSKVEWSKGAKARHAACTGTTPRTAAPSTTGTYGGYRTRYTPCEGWGSDNPHAPRRGHCPNCAAMG
jgi:hypothetical protein